MRSLVGRPPDPARRVEGAGETVPTVVRDVPSPGPVPDGMAWIPPGRFSMGSDYAPFGDARPIHAVELDGFWMDKTPVTNEQFARFARETGYVTVAERKPDPEDFPGVPPGDLVAGSLVFTPPPGPVALDDVSGWWRYVPGADCRHPEGPSSDIADRGQHPVVQVCWEDAAAYARWAGKRLPTEAEWEYAARGGLTQEPYAWGGEFRPGGRIMANTWQGRFPDRNTKEDGWERTAPVAQFPPNGFGLYDMAGNVWQWCADWYRPDYYLRSPANNPTGPTDSFDPAEPGVGNALQRGGSFLCSDQYCSRDMPGGGAREPSTPAPHTSASAASSRRPPRRTSRDPKRPRRAADAHRPEPHGRADRRDRDVHADLALACRRAGAQAERRVHPRRRPRLDRPRLPGRRSTTRRRTSTAWPPQGMRFTDGYTCGPNCQPTRAALMSGQYGPRTGVYTVGGIDRFDWQSRPAAAGGQRRRNCRSEKVTLAEALKAAGYATGDVRQVAPRPATADTTRPSAGSTRRIVTTGRHFDFATQPEGRRTRPGTYLADFLTDKAVDFIDAAQGRSRSSCTCRTSGSTAPHEAKPELIAKFREKPPAGGHNDPTYAAMIASVDESVGRVLRDARRAEAGGQHARHLHQRQRRGRRLRARGGEGQGRGRHRQRPAARRQGDALRGRHPRPVHRPLAGHASGRARRAPSRSLSVDLYPTLLELAGAQAPAGHPLDGVSLPPSADAAARPARIARRSTGTSRATSAPGRDAGGRPPPARSAPATGSCWSSSRTAGSSSTTSSTTSARRPTSPMRSRPAATTCSAAPGLAGVGPGPDAPSEERGRGHGRAGPGPGCRSRAQAPRPGAYRRGRVRPTSSVVGGDAAPG